MKRIGKVGCRYETWKEGWKRRQYAAGNRLIVCGDPDREKGCGKISAVLVRGQGGRVSVQPNVLFVCHKQGRNTHAGAPRKMAEDGVFWGCYECNAKMSGANLKAGSPQWGSNARNS